MYLSMLHIYTKYTHWYINGIHMHYYYDHSNRRSNRSCAPPSLSDFRRLSKQKVRFVFPDFFSRISGDCQNRKSDLFSRISFPGFLETVKTESQICFSGFLFPDFRKLAKKSQKWSEYPVLCALVSCVILKRFIRASAWVRMHVCACTYYIYVCIYAWECVSTHVCACTYCIFLMYIYVWMR